MSQELRNEILEDLQYQVKDIGSPTFTWEGSNYTFVPSIEDLTRVLDTGGFVVDKMLTAIVPKFLYEEGEYTSIFTNNVYPTAQNIITYSLDNTTFRIKSVKHDPTNSYFRIIAYCVAHGV